MFFQESSGINAVLFYTTRIFGAANTGIDPAIQTIIIGAVQVIITLFATGFVDKIGRKILLLTSGALMVLSRIVLGAYFFVFGDDPTVPAPASLSWLPVTFLSIFIIGYSSGFGPVSFLVLGEICAPDIKGFAGGVAITINSVVAFLVTKFFESMVSGLGIGVTFWIYSAFSLASIVFTLIMIPETKGISLEEIQQNLRKFKICSF
jgi:SP family facilitated glucose transporter-like MFS transporter 8